MERHASGTRLWLTVVIVLVLAGVAAYFAGTLVERAAGAQSAREARQQYAALKGQLAQADARNATLHSVNRLLSANVWAYRAAVALDNRNFGVADNAINMVATTLHGLDAAATGLNAAAVTAVQKQAASVKISVAQNLESQHTQVLALASSINALVRRATAAAGAKP